MKEQIRSELLLTAKEITARRLSAQSLTMADIKAYRDIFGTNTPDSIEGLLTLGVDGKSIEEQRSMVHQGARKQSRHDAAVTVIGRKIEMHHMELREFFTGDAKLYPPQRWHSRYF